MTSTRWSRFSTALTLAAALAIPALAGSARLTYPETRKVDVVETLHGVEVADPYRWLEDLDGEETKAWIEAQNKLTFSFLEQIPKRQVIENRLTKIWNFERFGAPFKRGGRYFYSYNAGLQPQSVWYVTEQLDQPGRVLLNPNELSTDGTVSVSSFSVSEDGKLLAYGLSDGGSDWVTIRVKSVDTGEDLPDVIKWVKFSGASWLKDGSGFYYSAYDEPKGNKLNEANFFQKLYFHKLGTPQSDDRLIYENKEEKDWGFGGSVTDDGRYLIITVWQGTDRKNRVYYIDLAAGKGEVVKLLDNFDARYDLIDNDGPLFWFFTDKDAPRGRVIAVDTGKPEPTNWRDVIPQADEPLESISCVGGQFIAEYLRDAQSYVRRFALDGTPLGNLDLPGLGSVGGFGGRRDETETFYTFTSFATPATIYRYDVPSGRSEIWRQPKVDFDPGAFESRQVFYTSKDGTRVPMFIVHKKGLKLDGNNPTYLYGYGGFNASMTPYFSVSNVVWMELGGVFAMPNLRGGGEYGKAWHDAGRLKNKQNVFDDFIAAAEWLIANKYTRPERLAIGGGSNGGLLVGAAMTQRPELFSAVICQVGVMDMLRFHKSTIGWAWVSDSGSPDDAEMFPVLRAYSPLHNLKPGTSYPATLLVTGDHDDRVVPWHSFKFAAALQAAQAGDAPTLIRVETRAGHGGGKPTAKIIAETADRWAFLVQVLGMSSAQ